MTDRIDPPRPMTPRIRAEGVSVSFGGRTVLDGVSIDASAGQVTGLIGPNGAGKTTLVNVLCGDLPPDRGVVSFDGAPLPTSRRRLAALGITRTHQNPGSIEEETVLEHVIAGAGKPAARTGFGTLLQAIPRAEGDERQVAERVLRLFKELGISGTANANPASLPYALRQRVALAHALISNPRLLLLDEPAAGLSTEESQELGRLLSALVSRPGRDCAVILIEHHVPMVLGACDTVVVLETGRVIAQGAPADIRRDPVVVDAYLGSEAQGPG